MARHRNRGCKKCRQARALLRYEQEGGYGYYTRQHFCMNHDEAVQHLKGCVQATKEDKQSHSVRHDHGW